MLYLGLTADGRVWVFRDLMTPQFVPACRLQLAGGSQAVKALEEVYSSLAAAAPKA